MLTKEQKLKLDKMVSNYALGIVETHKADVSLMKAWVARYRIAMGQELQKRCKH